MTEKLFYDDPYLKECQANIVEIINEDNNILVVLDKTIFYPEGGGQPSDTGKINDIKVTYVFEKNGTIYHQVERTPETKSVLCKIDFDRRFDHMQQHSGEHLLSGAILKLYGGNNKGFHLGVDYVTVDIDMNEIDENMINKIEEEVNNYIYLNESFKTYIVSKSECEKIPLRKQINVEEDIRIVEAKDMDCCACCGTHVLKTGEIGIVKIIKTEKYKGMTRIYFKCGKRALKDFENKHDIVTKLIRIFSANENDLVERIQSQCIEVDNLKKELSKLKKRFAEVEAKNIIENEKTQIVFRKYSDKDFEDIQLLSSELSLRKYLIIFVSLKDNKILFLNNTGNDINCGKVFKDSIKEYNGKGGGNASRAQGTFDNKEELIKFAEFLYSFVNE